MPAENVVKGGVLLLLLVACTKPSGVSAAEGEGPPKAKAEATPAAQVREAKPTPATPEPAQATQPAASAGATPAPAAAGEGSEAQVLIWGGGRTPEEGRKALERFEAEREGLEAVLSPGESYPRVVASDTLPGLNPGFHVVVLGACKPEEAKAPLAALQAFKPGVYARAVKMVLEAGSCPKIENGL
ncbi:MAG: hypothetical protein JXB05_24245, partial [Myxococcaceae bacterium]|nr:hypothetical protein [Myxococcaceae bacterium]